MKNRYNLKRIVSLFLLVFQVRMAGGISNIVNMSGVKNYNELVENFATFLESENITDPQHIYEYFNYAMWNGYLSKDKELKYSIDRKIYIDNSGMSITSGDAVCLNYADMLSCIYKELGFNSYIAMCYIDSNNAYIEKIRTDKGIERKINEGDSERLETVFDNIVIKNLTKVLGNHAVTCVEYNGEIYIYDPTNFAYLDKQGFNNINIVNGSGKFDLRYFTSILYDNINLFKIIPYNNDEYYKLEIVEKPELIFNTEALDKFHKENKNIINEIDKVNKRGTSTGIVEIMLYSIIASFILFYLRRIIKKIALNCKEKEIKDIKKISMILKEYFIEQNIETEFEVLKNFELINKELGIKNNIIKDIYNRSIITISNLINDDIFYNTILTTLLNELGYNASYCYVKKYHNNIPIGDRVIIEYRSEDMYYYYDPEIKELLYEDDKKRLYSINKSYKYKKYSKYDKYDTIKNKKDVERKMKEENTVLTKENIKELKYNKILKNN